MTCELTEKKITEILHTFYEKVRRDPLLSVPFSVVTDWDEHLVRLTEFWSSVMLTSGRYKGNPLSMHVIHADRIQPAMFNRWLELWQITTTEGLAPDVAQEMQAKATRIASRLSVAMFGHSTVRSSNTTPERSAPSPYKVTPSFDQASVPAALLRDHSLKAGSWGLIRVEEGSLRYREGENEKLLGPGTLGVIPPLIEHHLDLIGPVRFRIEFYDRQPLQNVQ